MNSSEIQNDLSILVVDDIPSARHIITRMLTSLGYTNVQEAESVAEARHKMELLGSKLIIVDLHLKDALGTELLDVIENDNSVTFVIVTSDIDKDSFEKAKKAGVQHYLLKPFSPDLLQEKINIALHS